VAASEWRPSFRWDGQQPRRATRPAWVSFVISVLLAAVVTVSPAWATHTVPSTCFGSAVGISGTDGADTLTGTTGNNVMASGDGDDTLWGRAGADKMCANHDWDVMHGEDGDDSLDGGNGDDVVYGEDQ